MASMPRGAALAAGRVGGEQTTRLKEVNVFEAAFAEALHHQQAEVADSQSSFPKLPTPQLGSPFKFEPSQIPLHYNHSAQFLPNLCSPASQVTRQQNIDSGAQPTVTGIDALGNPYEPTITRKPLAYHSREEARANFEGALQVGQQHGIINNRPFILCLSVKMVEENIHPEADNGDGSKSASSKDDATAYDRQVSLLVENPIAAHPGSVEGRMVDASGSTRRTAALIKFLPPAIRFKILSYLMPPQEKTVTLDREPIAYQIVPEGEYLVPGDILEDVWGLLASCRMMRDDVMKYFWGEFTFHVTISPLTISEFFDPLATKFLRTHAHMVQRLEIELDLTTFGLSSKKEAIYLATLTTKVRSAFTTLVKRLERRNPSHNPDGRTIEFLHVMCRRFAGFRPIVETKAGKKPQTPILYCPTECMEIIDDLELIGEMICCLRLSGFTEDYTVVTFNNVFESAGDSLVPVIMVSPAWPAITPQLVMVGSALREYQKRLLEDFKEVITEYELTEREREAAMSPEERLAEEARIEEERLAEEAKVAKAKAEKEAVRQYFEANAERVRQQLQEAREARAKADQTKVKAAEVEEKARKAQEVAERLDKLQLGREMSRVEEAQRLANADRIRADLEVQRQRHAEFQAREEGGGS